MMELYLSSDGKHTVSVSAQTAEEMIKLMPQAILSKTGMIYEAVARVWHEGADVEKRANGGANGNGNGEAHEERKAPLVPGAQ